MEKKLYRNYTRILHVVLNKWQKQHLTKQQLYSLLLLISQIIKEDKQNMLGTTGEVGPNSITRSFFGLLRINTPVLADQKMSLPPRGLVVLFYGVSTLFGSFNAELSYFDKSFKQFSLVPAQFFVYTELNFKTVLFQMIQFNIST